MQYIGYFLYRIRLTHAHFGVIFAKTGITGDEDQEKAAYSLIRKAFHEKLQDEKVQGKLREYLHSGVNSSLL